MRPFAWISSVTTALFKRSCVSDEMQEELDSHIQLRADDLQLSGMTRREAERRTRRWDGRFGCCPDPGAA